jgi:hypothetical protein
MEVNTGQLNLETNKILWADTRYLRTVEGCTRLDHVRNEDILERTEKYNQYKIK